MSVSLDDRRLQQYITSRTKMIPDDAELYIQGQRFENKCLFCTNPRATHPVISNGVDTYTHMCSWCYDIVQRELAIPITRKDFFREKSLLDSLNPGLGFVLPTNIQQYYLHLNTDKDYFANLMDHCYVCDRLPNMNMYADEEEFQTIEIPVRHNQSIVGGSVHICNDSYCNGVRVMYNNTLSKLGYNSLSKENDGEITSCPICRKRYHIVGKEIDMRRSAPESYEWQCPSCAYEMLNRWERDNDLKKFFPNTVVKGEPRSALLPRYGQRVCSCCLEYSSMDYLLTEFSFFLNHIFRDEYICKECSIIRTWLEQKSTFRLLNTRIYIEIHESDFSFSIFRLKRGELESITINSKTDATNIIDLMFIAMEETDKLIDDPELWK